MAVSGTDLVKIFVDVEPGSVVKMFKDFQQNYQSRKRCHKDVTAAVALYENRGFRCCSIFMSESKDVHTEVKLISYFADLLQKQNIFPLNQKIKVFLSYSPCSKCCRKILTFVSNVGSCLEVEIVLADLSGKSDSISSGVKALRDHDRIHLRAFRDEDLQELQHALGLGISYQEVQNKKLRCQNEETGIEKRLNHNTQKAEDRVPPKRRRTSKEIRSAD